VLQALVRTGQILLAHILKAGTLEALAREARYRPAPMNRRLAGASARDPGLTTSHQTQIRAKCGFGRKNQ
jgi:hypothetical protein